MNDDEPAQGLEALKVEHRLLDERIRVLCAEPIGKDQIQQMIDAGISDIIA